MQYELEKLIELQDRTNELLLALLTNSNKVVVIQDNHPWQMQKEIIEANYECLQEYKRAKENDKADSLLQLVLKQKQEIEEQFTKEFPQ